METSNGAFNHAESVISAIIEKINGKMNKSRQKFITNLFLLFMGLRGRYNFLNMARYGNYSEQSYRNNFGERFDFLGFNIELIKQKCSPHCILAFDPSYIPKSGKQTDHVGYFWSGTSSRALKGLEIGGLAAIDIENNTAFSLEAIQTPSPKELKAEGRTLVDHYAQLIVERSAALLKLSRYLAVDGYFSKHDFIETITATGLHIISKLRNDANLMYLHKREQKTQRGRPQKYDGKVDVKNIDKRRIRLEYEDEQSKVYGGIVWRLIELGGLRATVIRIVRCTKQAYGCRDVHVRTAELPPRDGFDMERRQTANASPPCADFNEITDVRQNGIE